MPNRVTLRVDEKDFPSRFGNQAVWVSGKGPLRWLGHHVLDKVAASYRKGIYLVVLSWVRLLGAVREIDCVKFHSYTERHLNTDNELVRNVLLAVLSSAGERRSCRDAARCMIVCTIPLARKAVERPEQHEIELAAVCILEQRAKCRRIRA